MKEVRKNLGQHVSDLWRYRSSKGRYPKDKLCKSARDVIVQKAAMSESTGATGGYLVPVELVVGIDQVVKEQSIFADLARQQPMKSLQCDMPIFDITTSHSTGFSPMLAGLAMTWGPTEGTALTETEPTFATNQLVAKILSGYANISNQLLDDGGEPLGEYLENLFGYAIAWMVEQACFQGVGTTQPLGITKCPAFKTVSRTTSSHIAYDDLALMVGAFFPECYSRAVWACNPTVLKDVAKLSAYQVQGGDGETSGLCGRIYGRPLYATGHLPVLGGVGDIVLFDPAMYVLGSRHLEIDLATEVPTAWQKNQSVFRLIWRGDGQPILKGTATLADGSTTASAYVGVAT